MATIQLENSRGAKYSKYSSANPHPPWHLTAMRSHEQTRAYSDVTGRRNSQERLHGHGPPRGHMRIHMSCFGTALARQVDGYKDSSFTPTPKYQKTETLTLHITSYISLALFPVSFIHITVIPSTY
ncbi:hypothetical protein M434DRAFT_362086 [Hypoxylon sp. CO27-5]|nr:hypothetical protein M434DRAFT_362086 [Hypoxylon sp. CO27-5]